MGKRALAVTCFAFALGLLAGLNAPPELVEQVIRIARELVGQVHSEDPLELTFRIFLNNARVLGVIVLLSPLVIAPVLIVFANGLILGVALDYAASRVSWAIALLAIVPHGVFEIPALLYAAAASASFGVALWRKVLGGGGSWSEMLALLLKSLTISLLLLAIAALIEAFVTPLLLRLFAGIGPLPV